MPIKIAAKKYIRVTSRKTVKNMKIKGLFRSAIKNAKEAVAKGSVDEAKEWLKKAAKFLDKATEKNIIHKNTAARKKSRLNKLVKSVSKK